ncbi:MAG: response regulator transcription factor [Nitrospirota bacterium]|nr:MAG: response regulator transcription factor [Nitrospirota bacterium]
MSKINIMIVDDHSLVREGISALLERHEDINVIAEASSGEEAIEKAGISGPNIVLMDISMPGLGGLEATLEIRKRYPDVRIIVLTQYDDKEYISRFLKAGASGYVIKKAAGNELISAIRAVNKGELYLHPSITAEVVSGYIGGSTSEETDDPYERLTGREKQILKLLAEGNSHKQIATVLDISIKTVIAHQTNISDKLDRRSKAELIKFAIQQGIIKIES